MDSDAGSPFLGPEDARNDPPPLPPPLPPEPVRLRRPRRYYLPFGDVFSKCFGIWVKNLIPFTILSALVYAPLLIAGAIFYRTDPGADARFWFESVVVLLVDSLFLNFLLAAAVTYGVVEQLRGRRPGIGRCLSAGVTRIPLVLVVVLLNLLAVLGGLLLLVIPGIIVIFVLYVAVPVAVIEGVSPVEALKRSAFLTRGNRMAIFGVVLCITMLMGVMGAIVGTVYFIIAGGLTQAENFAEGESGFWFGQIVGLLFQAPGAIIPAVIYHHLRVGKEGADIDDLVKVFE